ncbi:DUF2537 domain-containing protein [Amycolatopsis rubida]|uniref:DUF2537 domain-containing protein n=1 Tax=Amycolatopsis rubida TaxID=112413 RepID=A0A1I5W062_9PSEU|nr:MULTISPECIES: DUF2537 domain-containing protein [Amycolatopsis]MYW95376.1 DUF2537 domain-containing protein [Amycolatopsis rubida]NEC60365.1 DUF2537 domain-containing protein [Amycolatopsis rubida]OAP28219.1 hypothetical protein A4R44_00005 [Amycolatopsis sp. M39]SFQ13105.1 Protein of unknown function [Amycolatopsis rubida]
MELRIRGEQAVLAGPGGEHAREVDPRRLAIGADLAQALHEWARVASAVARSDSDVDVAGSVVSQRGRQLAARLAAVMGAEVRFVDPVTGVETVVEPPPRPDRPARARTQEEPTPWLTGLTVSVFAAAVVVVAMLALATTLARETSVWLALIASLVVTGGVAPSLWLGRNVPILRWAVYGAGGGLALAWIGVLATVF